MVEGDKEPEQMRKLFIGGLDYRTDDEGLREYFEQYGEIVDCVVMKDPKSRRSRGFGFVAYARAYMVDEAQSNRPHKIDGRTVESKRAVPRDEINRPESNMTVKKLFVGGLRGTIEEDELRESFNEFGNIVEVIIPLERDSEKKRGFAFIEFDDYDSVDKACVAREIRVNGKRVEVKKALSKTEMQQRGGRNGGSPWDRNDSFRDNRRNFRDQGNYGGGSRRFNNPSPWQDGGPGSQNWGGNSGPGGWGGNPVWTGPQGGGPNGWNSGGSNNFGNSYSQNYSGGPMRNSNFGGPSRSGPYGGGGSHGHSGGGSYNRRY